MNKVYRNHLLKTLVFLEDSSGNLLAEILNISSLDDMPMLRENFDEGEIFEFNVDMFVDSKDLNILKLVNLYKIIENQRIDLMKENHISEEEMDSFYLMSEIEYDDDDDEDDPDLLNDMKIFLN